MSKAKQLLLVFTLLLAIVLVACGQQVDGILSDDVKTIVIGTGTQFPNICFIDEDGKLTGYDVELMRAVDEKLTDYHFEFQTMEFSNLLLSLETNKIDVVAHQMEVNEERSAKFLFNKEPYNIFPLKVTVHQDNEDIHSIDDLAGKTVSLTPTSNAAVFFEKYNQEQRLGAKIIYGTNTVDTTERLKTGRVDAVISTPFAVQFYNEQAGAQQKVVGDTLLSSKTYFLFNKEDEELANRVDEALKELKEEGVVAELSKQWLGEDYSSEFEGGL